MRPSVVLSSATGATHLRTLTDVAFEVVAGDVDAAHHPPSVASVAAEQLSNEG